MEQSLMNRLPLHRGPITVIGGGTLIHHHWYQIASQALRHGKRLIIFGPGVESPDLWPPASTGCPQLADWADILRNSIVAGVRGPDSAETLRSLGLDVPVIGDPACCFVQDSRTMPEHKRRIGISVSENLGQANPLAEKSLNQLVRALQQLRSLGMDIEIFIVSRSDEKATDRIIEECVLKNAPVHRCYADASRFVSLAKRMNVFVGVRLHSVILAMCAAVPSIMLSYRPKGGDFMRSVDMSDWEIPLHSLADELLVERVEALTQNAERVSVEVLKNMRQWKLKQEAAARFVMAELAARGERAHEQDA
jgi:polysaccharide pyruvyl transferase WcaK-like protein